MAAARASRAMGQEAVAYLLRNGVTEAAVAAAFSLCGDKDACQSLPTQRQVASVAAFLRAECGLADADVAKALNRSPRVLLLELASMRQKVVLLGKWLKAPGELAAAVVAFPALLCLKRNECRESLQYLKSDAGLSHRQMKHCLISHPEVLGYAHKMKARPDAEMRTEQPGDGRRCVRACVGISAHLEDE